MNRIFDNTEVAFRLKSNLDLRKAQLLFTVMGKPSLVKIGTSLTNFAIQYHLPVKSLIKKTIFQQFCGGISEEDCLSSIKSLNEVNVKSILDYSVEGKENEHEFDATRDKLLSLLKFSDDHKGLSFLVFKPTALGRFELWRKITEHETLSKQEEIEWQRVKDRFDAICKAAADAKLPTLIDGEESWMQGAADSLVEEMMEKYNKQEVIIFNTIQCYRWDRLSYVKVLHETAKQKNFKIGVKIVRGAYMEKENFRALEKGYASPICESKLATDDNFNAVMEYGLDNLEDFGIFIGTHNEASNYLALKILNEKGIRADDKRVWFGQLFGMSDNLTFNLAERGYNVAKYMPFGPVKEVIPYLIRRAEENTSVAGQTGRELTLLNQELERRKKLK
ncbi:proline dehydrogenase family protein [Zhouia sp. PK063]|uniref:proline dehydrogenase family protein n=1 Tax=Zhouia sp. PK063 TaxID=3373602 RepID=UPI00379A4472